jgi:hypothetical protein
MCPSAIVGAKVQKSFILGLLKIAIAATSKARAPLKVSNKSESTLTADRELCDRKCIGRDLLL